MMICREITRHTMYQKVVQWANERKLIENGNKLTQMLKGVSEVGELNGNIAMNNPIIDDVGDILVTLIILAEQAKTSFPDLSNILGRPTPEPALPMFNMHIGLLADLVAKDRDIKASIYTCVEALKRVADFRGVDLLDALKYAYEEIKDRRGYLNENGVFIKEEDNG